MQDVTSRGRLLALIAIAVPPLAACFASGASDAPLGVSDPAVTEPAPPGASLPPRPDGGEPSSLADSGAEPSTSKDASADAKADASTPVLGSGLVSILQREYDPTSSIVTSQIGASFAFGASVATPAGCTRGPFPTTPECEVTECAAAPPAPFGGTPVSGGDVTLSGLLDGGTITMPVSGTAYPSGSTMSLVFGAGQVITLSSTGGTVPAIAALTAAAPAPILMMTKTLRPTPTASPELSRSAPLTLTWSNPGAGVVRPAFSSNEPGVHYTRIICEFPSAPGTLTVPAAVLQKLAAPNDAGTISRAFRVESMSHSEVITGGYLNRLEVRGLVKFPDGTGGETTQYRSLD